MGRITEDMVRRRAEHNNSEIFSLEELSLHQQDIERLEHLGRWCRELRILYLQNNLIPRIENVGRLKKLEYLNLALNNIEVIENLEGCESLQKLDLTVNFVSLLSSVGSLRSNTHLKELFLLGNPCAQYQGYRPYVISTLPQLQSLDGEPIKRAERLRAGQDLETLKRRVLEQEAEQLQKREREKREGRKDNTPTINNGSDNASPACETEQLQKEKEFWETPCDFSPESRLEAHRHLEEKKRHCTTDREKKPKKSRTLITEDGRVLNVNEPKLDFTLTEDEENSSIQLDLHVYRHMDSSLMEVDVQPTYIRVMVKGKVFQLVLSAEVKPDASSAQRSQATGHLLITMPRAHGEVTPKKLPERKPLMCHSNQHSEEKGREWLEVDPSKSSRLDLTNIATATPTDNQLPRKPLERPTSKHFEDDPDVPPLI
ncbi:dynein axonemal assembly factor 11 [Clupea harengus]|uniref:Leucine-rich repeat-containing protein 6 n=1 Tax=Clupea harengus TaxID=7950 RepID=A0A6P8GII5_CLUHA|nr:dynein axonemal assembly factor 11 [Clupea harengus]